MRVCEVGSTTRFIRTSRFFVNSRGNWKINISRLVTLYQTKKGTPKGFHIRSASKSDVKRNSLEIEAMVDKVGDNPPRLAILAELFPVTTHAECDLPSQAKMRNVILEQSRFTIEQSKAIAREYYNHIKYRRRKCRIVLALSYFTR